MNKIYLHSLSHPEPMGVRQKVNLGRKQDVGGVLPWGLKEAQARWSLP